MMIATCWTACLGLALAVSPSAQGQAEEAGKREATGKREEAGKREATGKREGHGQHPAGLIGRAMHLLPPAFAEEMDLKPNQREKVSKLEQEFKQHRQALLLRTAMRVAGIIDQERTKHDVEAPFLTICHEVTGGLLEMRKARLAFEKKMLSLFTAEQREQFEDLKELTPREWRIMRREQRRAIAHDGPLMPHECLEHLKLTAEQHKKLKALLDTTQTQFRNLLTEEQRTRLDGLMRGRRQSDNQTGLRNERRERRKEQREERE